MSNENENIVKEPKNEEPKNNLSSLCKRMLSRNEIERDCKIKSNEIIVRLSDVFGVIILFLFCFVIIAFLVISCVKKPAEIEGMWMSSTGDILYFENNKVMEFDMDSTYVNEYPYNVMGNRIYIDETEYKLAISNGVLSMTNGKSSYPEYTRNTKFLDRILTLKSLEKELSELEETIATTQLEKTVAILQGDSDQSTRLDERLIMYREDKTELENEIAEVQEQLKLK